MNFSFHLYIGMNIAGDNATATTYGEKLRYSHQFLARKGQVYKEYATTKANLWTLTKENKEALVYQFGLTADTPTRMTSAQNQIVNQFRIAILYPPSVIDLITYVYFCMHVVIIECMIYLT